jgi:hypothetical protein
VFHFLSRILGPGVREAAESGQYYQVQKSLFHGENSIGEDSTWKAEIIGTAYMARVHGSREHFNCNFALRIHATANTIANGGQFAPKEFK